MYSIPWDEGTRAHFQAQLYYFVPTNRKKSGKGHGKISFQDLARKVSVGSATKYRYLPVTWLLGPPVEAGAAVR